MPFWLKRMTAVVIRTDICFVPPTNALLTVSGEMIASRSFPERDGQLGLVGLSLTCDGEG